MNKELNQKLDDILENQHIIVQQGLFLMEYLIGDDERRKQVKAMMQPISAEMNMLFSGLEEKP